MTRRLDPPNVEPILAAIVAEGPASELFRKTVYGGLGPAPGGKYRHWENFRHLQRDDGLSPEQRWAAVKFARKPLYRPIPLYDVHGRSFQYGLPAIALELLHRVDRDASGIIGSPAPVTNPETQTTYLLKSIIEEAIKSSQLEGASTTRRVAKDMLLAGREPRDRSERMILNNFHAMQHVRRVRTEQLTPSRVMELQAILTEGTLDDASGAGRLRRGDERIVVQDELGAELHVPPDAEQLDVRLALLCAFANGGGTEEFMHPVVRAILVHFWLAYDHPFIDGNGRTARALFYWVMAREGYWLAEYVSMSRILRKAPAQYARAFLYTETDENDTTYFVLHQLGVLTRAIADLHSYLERKATEVREVEDLVRQRKALHAALNPRQLDLLTHALKHDDGEYTVQSHRRAHGVAYGTARADLLSLAGYGFMDQRKRGRAFVFLVPPDLRDRMRKSAGARRR